jgi:predicted transcriptional regulator
MEKKVSLGRAESEVLRYIAERHPISVREVAEGFSHLRKTTILNVMERLREKGFLTRTPESGVYQYSPTRTQAALMSGLVAEFVDSMLGGSLEPLAAYLAEKETLSEAEIGHLKAIISKLEEKR